MKIKQIHIQDGYKRFHDLTIDLGKDPKRIIALVGPNGCGKSSVFDAILYAKTVLFGAVGQQGNKDQSYHSMFNKNFSGNPVKITFEDGSEPVNYSRDDFNIKNGTRTMFSFRSPYRYNNKVKINQISSLKDISKNQEGASFSSDIDSKMDINYRRLQGFYNNYMHENDVKPSEAKIKIIGDLNSSIENCLNLKIDNLGNIENNQGTIYFVKPDQPNPFEFNVLSSGEKEVIDILLDLYLRREKYDDTVFLIDEPELHINTAIQKNLLIEINKLVGKNCQIWISTHSIGFLRALQNELEQDCSIIEFKKDANYASESYTLTPMKPSFHNWRNLFSTALDDLTHLISPERIIYCEGRDRPKADGQEQGMDAIVYNNIFGQKYSSTLFVSSGGNTELDQRSSIAFKILSKVFIDFDIMILKDRDVGSGKYMSLQDRQDYLDNNRENHTMLERLEIENYIFDKEVIKSYCSKNGKDFDETAYDEKVTDIINQDIKDLGTFFKKLCGITGSVNQDKFKINLSNYISEDMNVYKELEKNIFKN